MNPQDRTLATWLRASRYVGIAPYGSLQQLQISRPFVLYSRILFFCYEGMTLLMMISVTQYRARSLTTWESVIDWTMTSFEAVLTTGILYLGMFHSPRRLQRTFYFCKRVKKISQSIGRMPTADPAQRQVTLQFVMVYFVMFILIAVEVCIIFKRIHSKLIKTIFKVSIINSMYFMSNIILAYFVLVAMKISSPFLTINKQLVEIASEMQSNDKNLVPEKLRTLARAYVATCGLVRQHNSSEEMLLLLLLLDIVANLANSVYIILTKGLYKDDMSAIAIEAIWYTMHVARGMLIAAPWHKMDDEVARIRNLICKLMCKVRSTHDPVLAELEVFHIQLTANRPSYTTFGIFTMKRPLVLTMIAFVTTGLAFVE